MDDEIDLQEQKIVELVEYFRCELVKAIDKINELKRRRRFHTLMWPSFNAVFYFVDLYRLHYWAAGFDLFFWIGFTLFHWWMWTRAINSWREIKRIAAGHKIYGERLLADFREWRKAYRGF